MPSTKTVMLICSNILFVSASFAQLTNLYPDDTLRKWKTIYEKNIQLNFKEYIAGPMEINIPIKVLVVLRPDQQDIDEYNFYSRGNTIYIPVSALLFLDQLFVAYSWLNTNNYDLETIFDYMGMLRLQHFKNGIPPVLPTLGIPAHISGTKADEDAKIFTTHAFLWLMAHEAGHIVKGHTGYVKPSGQTKLTPFQKEDAADEFATSVFRKLHDFPVGAAAFFAIYMNLFPHRGDYPDEASWNRYVALATHPLNSERLSAIAASMRTKPEEFTTIPGYTPKVLYWAAEFQKLADTLGDKQVQEVMVVRSLMAKPEYLMPRKKGETTTIPDVKNSDRNFEGMYSGTFAHRVNNPPKIETVPAQMSMIRDGNQVRGCFNFGLGVGTIEGQITAPNQLSFVWHMANATGKGVFKNIAKDNSSLSGTWGNTTSESDSGKWELKKMKK